MESITFILSDSFVAFLHVVLGEHIPKILAIRNVDKIGLMITIHGILICQDAKILDEKLY